MRNNFFKSTALAVGLAFTTMSTGCAYVLHPQQRGNKGGALDVPMLVCDCLWLIVGIIPGVVCLVVDFVNGAIYKGGVKGHKTNAKGDLQVKLPETTPKGSYELRLVSPKGQVVSRDARRVVPSRIHDRRLSVSLDQAADLVRQLGPDAGEWQLELATPGGKTARLPIQLTN